MFRTDTLVAQHAHTVSSERLTPVGRNLQQIREDEFAQGEEYGVTLATAENTLEFLEDLAPVDDSLKELIQSQTDLTLLKKWLKLAARADSIEAFKEQIQAK